MDDRAAGALEAFVASAPPPVEPSTHVEIETPGRIGTIDTRAVYRQGDAIIIYSNDGCGLADGAGIAYLPSGPFRELETGVLGTPECDHVTGPWFRFCARW